MNQEIQKVIEYVEAGRTEEGLAQLKKIEKSAHDEEKFLIADLYYQWGMVEDALRIAEDLQLLYPEEADITLLLSEIYMELDEEEKVIQLLSTIPSSHPSYPRSLILLADLYQLQGLPEVSEQKLLEAKSLLPDEKIIDFALGELYFHLAQYKKAISAYELVLKEVEEITNINVHSRLAECLSLNGQFEEALEHYQKGIQSHADLHTFFGYGITAMQAEYYQTAITQLEKVKEMDPEYTSVYLPLARSYEHEGMLKESLDAVKSGIQYDEFNKELYYYGGKIALKMQSVQQAEQLMQEALALDPGYIEAAITLTDVYNEDERYEETVELLTDLINKFDEFDPKFDWNLAKAYNGIEQYSDALKHYERAYTFFKEDIDFLQEFAYFALEEGDRKRAKSLFEEAAKLDSTNVEIQDMILQLEDNFS
ncbi:tetratricopeptide repeat protein [Bacillus kexueae]|uniref:tetratricopeptide repeat protein n=1 Tax=Aeribacillus kexueae TaxID=2078952 RepID=UPI001FAECC68|nr:tetratricopeptide repeat protein [Bacillus kexueae]